MASTSELARILSRAYFAPASTLPEFAEAYKDPDFAAAARAEYARLQTLEKTTNCALQQRCHASAQQLSFLRVALAQG